MNPGNKETTTTTLITGGSRGIGLKLAELFAPNSDHLALVSLEEKELDDARKRLKNLKPDLNVHTLAIDLAEGGAARKVYAWTSELGLKVDTLINNAGFGTYGFMPEIPMEKEADMIRLHILTLYELTRFFLDDMLKRDTGRIVNLSSISAFQPNPMLTTYGASKSFVLQFSRGLNYELRESGSRVTVTAVCPTPVRDTAFQSGAGMEDTNTFNSWMTVNTNLVARAAYLGALQGKELVIPGRLYNVVHWFTRLLPMPLQTWLSRQHLRRTRPKTQMV